MQWNRDYYARNVDVLLPKGRERRRIWKLKNKDRARAYDRIFQKHKRARKFGAVCSDLKEVEKIYKRAEHLRTWFDVTVDHIVPLRDGGRHAPNNLQIIYRSENVRKARRLDYIPRIIFS